MFFIHIRVRKSSRFCISLVTPWWSKKHGHKKNTPIQIFIVCFDTRKHQNFESKLPFSKTQGRSEGNSLFCLPQLENFDVKRLKLQWLTTKRSWWFRICLLNVHPYLVRRSFSNLFLNRSETIKYKTTQEREFMFAWGLMECHPGCDLGWWIEKFMEVSSSMAKWRLIGIPPAEKCWQILVMTYWGKGDHK